MDTYADGSGPIDLSQYQKAIQSIESGGNYGAVGPATASGDRAYGAYQVMGSNIPDWTAKHYGQSLTPDQFLKNKEAQDAVFNGEFGAAMRKHGNPQDAASVWFSGRPLAQAGNSSDGYNTVPQYVAKFNKALGGTGALSFASTDDDEDEPKKDKGALATNNVVGNGALTPTRLLSAPKDDDRLSKVAQGLTGIGASIAGISSPQQSYALNQQLAAMKKDNEGKYKMMVTKDGRVLRIDGDGNIDSIGGNPAGSTSPQMLGDPTKTGDAYLGTLSPVDGKMVTDLIEGRIPFSPYATKDPRMQQLIAASGQVDPDFSVNTWAARNTMAKDLAKSNPASLGGILANGQSAFRHLGLASDGFVNVGNSNGYNGPGGNLAAQGYNALKNYGGSSALADKLTAANEEISKYGTESTKYYAGSPGGVHERAAAQHATDPWTASGAAQAGYIDASKSLMIERGKELENHIRETMGQRYLDKHPVFSEETNKLIDRIDGNVKRLRDGPSPSQPASPAGSNTFKTPTGKQVNWSIN